MKLAKGLPRENAKYGEAVHKAFVRPELVPVLFRRRCGASPEIQRSFGAFTADSSRLASICACLRPNIWSYLYL